MEALNVREPMAGLLRQACEYQLQKMFQLHGDAIARQYAGSGALHKERLTEQQGTAISQEPESASKTKRFMWRALQASQRALQSTAGVASNAVSAARRYYKQNFTDKAKQDAIDTFLGHFKAQTNGPFVWSESRSRSGQWPSALLKPLNRSCIPGFPIISQGMFLRPDDGKHVLTRVVISDRMAHSTRKQDRSQNRVQCFSASESQCIAIRAASPK